MRRRILTAILSITAITVLLFGIPLAVLVGRFVNENADLHLERQAVIAARDVPGNYASSRDPVELPRPEPGVSLALYDLRGGRIVGSGPPTADGTTSGALMNRIATGEAAGSRIVAVPVTADERIVGVIRASQPTSISDSRIRRIILLFAALAIGVIGIAALLGYIVATRLARPVRRLRDTAVQIGDGDFTVAVASSNIPELDDAGRALTATARRLDDLVGRERAFSADASHQLRTPLAGLRAGIETELEFPRDDRTDVLRESLDDISRLEQTISELLTIARTPQQQPASCALGDVLQAVDRTWHDRFARAGRPLRISDATDVPRVAGSGDVLRHALDVLVDNALLHGAGETRI
ncbi:MAG: histidine kinase dimerization/phospho-acceptor domain-containing protein, partial [Ilumatobacteraceae bacterium]